MVEKSVVLSTVKNMLDSGLDFDIIKETLKDIGLSDPEINDVLREARSEKAPNVSEPEPRRQESAEDESPEAESGDSEGSEVPDTSFEQQPVPSRKYAPQEPASNELSDSAGVQNAVIELGSKIEELKEKIESASFGASAAHSGSSAPGPDVSLIQARLDSLSNDVKELKAGTNALVDLMKKILETDRQVLLSMEGKKK